MIAASQTSLSVLWAILSPILTCWCWIKLLIIGPTVRGETDGDNVAGLADEDGACIELKLFCDVMFLDLIKGGFFIDDENAKPRRNVALKLI